MCCSTSSSTTSTGLTPPPLDIGWYAQPSGNDKGFEELSGWFGLVPPKDQPTEQAQAHRLRYSAFVIVAASVIVGSDQLQQLARFVFQDDWATQSDLNRSQILGFNNLCSPVL